MNPTVSATAAGERSKGHKRQLALVAQRTSEARQAFTVARDMMARPGAVNTLRTRLAATVSVEPRRAACSQQSAAGEERESVNSVGWNKRYAIIKQSMTKVIKNYSREDEERQQREGESRKVCRYCIHSHLIRCQRQNNKTVTRVVKVYFMLSCESSLMMYKCQETHNCVLITQILLKECETLRDIQKVIILRLYTKCICCKQTGIYTRKHFHFSADEP